MKILVTGSAGFIGFHLSNKLAELGHDVFGIDNINNYYDVNLKLARLEKSGFDRKLIKEGKKVVSKRNSNFQFVKQDLLNKTYLEELFKEERFDTVCNLSAQAGVRYSLEKPDEYLKSNIDCLTFPVNPSKWFSSVVVILETSTFPLALLTKALLAVKSVEAMVEAAPEICALTSLALGPV